MATQTDNHDAVTNPAPQPNSPSESEDEKELSLEELLYSSASYHAIVKPVTLTMILSALAVVYINTTETIQEGEEALSNAYATFDNRNPNNSTAETLGLSFLNALIIVGAICAMTFVIVLLYKYRCMWCLTGYMVWSFSALLGFMGGVMFDVAINKYSLNIDWFSFVFFLWNFAIVGALAIFWQQGVPPFVTQGYLIATSVILAWQLSHFDAWTSWTLLIMLALYDLCAVLTPCGPLKALVNLMSQDDAPDMPGLLYEAELPTAARRPNRRRQRRQQQQQQQEQQQQQQEQTNNQESCSSETERTGASSSTVTSQNADTGSSTALSEECATATESEGVQPDQSPPQNRRRLSQQLSRLSTGATSASSSSSIPEVQMTGSGETVDSQSSPSASTASETGPRSIPNDPGPPPTGPVPFAIAKIYRLQLVQEEPRRRPSWEPLLEDQEQQGLSPNDLLARQYTVEQLQREVEAIFPRGGGRIDRVEIHRARRTSIRYQVKDRHGEVKRVLFVDTNGRVMQETEAEDHDDEHGHKDNSIKLGLGDFIFYSVLVSKAAQYSFTTFIACMLVILAGLGSTLVLLAVYQQALPALPISIFLGVIFYLVTRWLIEPWIEHVLWIPYYV